MKRILYIGCLLLFSCTGEDAWDCLQAAGDISEKIYSVEPFTKIRIEGEVSLILKEEDNQQVRVTSGENLFSDISVRLEGETLVVTDNNKCNLVRDYGLTTAFVTASNISEIRNSSSFNVESDGVLTYPNLLLISDTRGGIEDVRKGGDFRLNLNAERLRVRANGQSAFYLSGNVTRADIRFTDEFPRLEAENLAIERLEVFQVSANKMIVNPLMEIKGEIRGTGDIISVNRPSIIEVEEFFTGRLIFRE